jgi:hypothetical protein
VEILGPLVLYFAGRVVSATVDGGQYAILGRLNCGERNPTEPETSDERTFSLYQRNGLLCVLRQATANFEWGIAALARRKWPILL